MTRIAHLQPHYTDSELKNHYLQANNRVEARRWHLLWLISQQRTIKEAAAVIGINYDYAKEVVKSYNQQGEKGMIKGQTRPKKRPIHALLNAQQLEELRLSLQAESPFDSINDLEEVLTERCQILSTAMTEQIKKLTYYHWWPEPEF